MIKWIISILMALLLIPVVIGTECQISEDNETWVDIASTKHGGCTDDTYNMAYAQNLDAKTNYFIRCKNDSTSWGYLSQRTDEEDNMFAGLGILLIGITIAFVYFAIHSKQRVFQIFFALLTFLMVIADFRFASIMVESSDSSLTGLIHNLDTMYAVSIIIFRFLLVFTSIMLLYWTIKLIKNWNKKKREMREESWELGFK